MKSSKRINLLTPDLKRPSAIANDVYLLGVIIVIIGTVSMITTIHNQTKRKLQETVLSKEGELQSMERTIASLSSQTPDDPSNAHIRWIEDMKSQQVKWSDSFKELSLIIPKESWLIYLKFSNESGKIETTIRGETSSQMKIAHFYDGLKNSYYYREIALKSSDLLPTFQPPLFRFSFETPAKKTSSAESQNSASKMAKK